MTTRQPMNPAAAMSKKANRRGFKTKRKQQLITMFDRKGREILTEASVEMVGEYLNRLHPAPEEGKPA